MENTNSVKIESVGKVYYDRSAVTANWDCDAADGSLLTLEAEVGYEHNSGDFYAENPKVIAAYNDDGDELDIASFNGDEILDACLTLDNEMFDKYWRAYDDFVRS